MGKFAAVIAGAMLAVTAPAWAGDLEDGVAAYGRSDFATALALLQPLADKGDAQAQTHIGMMHDEGHGIPLDDLLALEWYRLAAGQGYADAQFLMGTMYDLGEGVLEDNEQAVQWYRMAAKQRNQIAMEIVASYEKFEILGNVLAYDTGLSEIHDLDHQWLEDLLLANPGITTMQLTSHGGDILAAYPMADVIINFGLDTNVVGDCASACIVVFLAGDVRTLQRRARLGFHQTAWEADNMRQFYETSLTDFGWGDEFDFAAWVYSDAVNDVLVELQFLLERGVDPAFAIKTIEAPPDEMWFPTHAELEQAGIIRQ